MYFLSIECLEVTDTSPEVLMSFPEEIMEIIFSYFTVHELLTISLTCSYWKDVILRVIRDKIYYIHKESLYYSRILLLRTPEIRNVALCSCISVYKVNMLLEVLLKCDDLRYFRISHISPKDRDNLLLLLEKFGNLEVFEFRDLFRYCTNEILQKVGKLSYLKRFFFDSSLNEAVTLQPIIYGCPRLENIHICTSTYYVDEFVKLLEIHGPRLKHLAFDAYGFTRKYFPYVNKDKRIVPLTSCPNLEDLRIFFMDMDDEIALAEILQLKKLKCLVLRYCRSLLSSSIIEWNEFQSRNLEELSLGYCVVDTNILKNIFKQCPNIKKLTFCMWSFKDHDTTGFEMMHTLPLESLYVTHPYIHRKDSSWVTNTILNCRLLKHLYLDRVKMHNSIFLKILQLPLLKTVYIKNGKRINSDVLYEIPFDCRVRHLTFENTFPDNSDIVSQVALLNRECVFLNVESFTRLLNHYNTCMCEMSL